MPKPLWKQLLDASQVGLNLVFATIIGLAMGHYIVDRYLHVAPWGTIIFFFLGIAAGLRDLIKYARRKDEEE
ncbi:MAG: AtpZ/AtpI family protein [Nitrospiraceae bacterium]|nr:AtpZ/AtpI family protein [Nitrospiraceae bacterium]